MRRKKKRKPSATEKMVNKMDERRDWINQKDVYGRQRYRQLNNELCREVDKAKEKWWSKACDELEELDSKGRSDLLYAEVAKLTWNKKVTIKNASSANGAGNRVTEPDEVRER